LDQYTPEMMIPTKTNINHNHRFTKKKKKNGNVKPARSWTLRTIYYAVPPLPLREVKGYKE
jgi:hypothetical protein